MKEKTRIADLERQLQDAQFQLQVLKDKWSAIANGTNGTTTGMTGMGQNSTTDDSGIDATVQADNASSASSPTNTDQTRDRVIVSSVFLPAFWSQYTRDTDADADADSGRSQRYVHVVDSRELSKTQSGKVPGDVRVVIIRDLRALRKDIWKIYEKKMVVAEADKRRGNAVIGLAEFVAAFLLGQYGTKVMVKRALVELAASLNANRQVGLFSRDWHTVRPVRLRPASSQRK